jgi:hypothetical protein
MAATAEVVIRWALVSGYVLLCSAYLLLVGVWWVLQQTGR